MYGVTYRGYEKEDRYETYLGYCIKVFKKHGLFKKEFIGYLHNADKDTLEYTLTQDVTQKKVWDASQDASNGYERVDLLNGLNKKYKEEGTFFKFSFVEIQEYITHDEQGNEYREIVHWNTGMTEEEYIKKINERRKKKEAMGLKELTNVLDNANGKSFMNFDYGSSTIRIRAFMDDITSWKYLISPTKKEDAVPLEVTIFKLVNKLPIRVTAIKMHATPSHPIYAITEGVAEVANLKRWLYEDAPVKFGGKDFSFKALNENQRENLLTMRGVHLTTIKAEFDGDGISEEDAEVIENFIRKYC